MADSVVEIFNGDITNAQLVSGYDVVTTDANTTYVIKDVQSVGGFYSSVPATINNTLVGDFSSNLSGSEIMDVNSTLNITGAEYSFNNIFIAIYNDTADEYQSTLQGTINGTKALEEFTNTSATLSSIQPYSIYDFRPTMKFGDSYYQFNSDGNSTTNVYYWATKTSGRTDLQTTAYLPMAYSIANQEIYYVKSDQGLYKHSPVSGESLIRSSLGTFSSYPRAAYCNGWFFYIPSSSEPAKIFCINVENGRKVTFSSLPSSEMSTYFQLVVSYDKASDKFYMYRRDSSWNVGNFYIRRSIPSVTKTQMDALVSDQIYYDSSHSTVTTAQAENLFQGKYSANTIGGSHLYPSADNGNEIYFLDGSGGADYIEAYVWNYAEMTLKSAYKSSYNYGTSLSALATFEHYIPNSTEIASSNYNPSPDMRLRITGVKTTTA